MVTVNACVGIAESSVQSAITVYPNPNNGVFSIVNASASAFTDVEITDAQGKLVYTSHDENTPAGFVRQVSLNPESSGIYVVRVLDGESQSVFRIVIQR